MKFMRSSRALSPDSDPLEGVANLFDTAVVFIAALLLALIAVFDASDLFSPKSDLTILKRNDRGEMTVIEKRGRKFRAVKMTREEAAGCGVRLGTAVQDMTQAEISGSQRSLFKGAYADCWGEIVAGCQVEIARVNKTAFYMGWMARFKCLFTRTQARVEQPNIEINDASVTYLTPIYIPGFGSRDDISWGISYHLGWRF